MPTGNPVQQLTENVPFDYLCKSGTIHQELWLYLLRSGPPALASAQKTVLCNVDWLHPLFKVHYDPRIDIGHTAIVNTIT